MWWILPNEVASPVPQSILGVEKFKIQIVEGLPVTETATWKTCN